jgi:hypothetical protein
LNAIENQKKEDGTMTDMSEQEDIETQSNWDLKRILLLAAALIILIIVLLLTTCNGVRNFVGIGGDQKVEPVKTVDKEHLILPPGCELTDGDTVWTINCQAPEPQCGGTEYWTQMYQTVHDAACAAKCDCPACGKKKIKPPETGDRRPPPPPHPQQAEGPCYKTRVITSAELVVGIYLTALDHPGVSVVGASCSGRRCKFSARKTIVVKLPCGVRLGYFNLVTESGQWSVDTRGASQVGSQEVTVPHYEVEVDHQLQRRAVKARGGDWVYDVDNPQGTPVHNTGDQAEIQADPQ